MRNMLGAKEISLLELFNKAIVVILCLISAVSKLCYLALNKFLMRGQIVILE